MTALVLALLAVPVGPADAVKAFERLKGLEGNWRSKDGPSLSIRLTRAGTAVVESVHGQDQALLGVTVYRVEGQELVGVHDGDAHLTLRLVELGDTVVRLDGAGADRTLSVRLTTPDAVTLTRATVVKVGGKDTSATTSFKREYLDRLK